MYTITFIRGNILFGLAWADVIVFLAITIVILNPEKIPQLVTAAGKIIK